MKRWKKYATMLLVVCTLCSALGGMQASAAWKKTAGGWRYTVEMYYKNQWGKIGGNWYYFDSNGYMKTGWQQVGGNWYYLGNNGVMKTGWQKVDGSWYYLADNGAMQTGWKQVSGRWYYLKADGAMKTGWLRSGADWYYLKADGTMATGTCTIDDKRETFDASGRLLGYGAVQSVPSGSTQQTTVHVPVSTPAQSTSQMIASIEENTFPTFSSFIGRAAKRTSQDGGWRYERYDEVAADAVTQYEELLKLYGFKKVSSSYTTQDTTRYENKDGIRITIQRDWGQVELSVNKKLELVDAAKTYQKTVCTGLPDPERYLGISAKRSRRTRISDITYNHSATYCDLYRRVSEKQFFSYMAEIESCGLIYSGSDLDFSLEGTASEQILQGAYYYYTSDGRWLDLYYDYTTRNMEIVKHDDLEYINIGKTY